MYMDNPFGRNRWGFGGFEMSGMMGGMYRMRG
jgi:hypothetical protein